MKTTAKVEHQDFVPQNWLAFEFCKVEFSGMQSEEIKRRWQSREVDLINAEKVLYEKIEEEIELLKNKVAELYSRVNTNKPLWRFWHTKEEKSIISDANMLLRKAEKESEYLKQKKANRYFDRYWELKKFLEAEGFVMVFENEYEYVKECVTKTELWVRY